MMKSGLSMVKGLKSKWVIGVIAACVLLCPAMGLAAGTTLMVQQTPADGGTVTPDLGIHNFGVNSVVTMSAAPRPGYQFVYWLGDVTDPTSQTTMATLDGPKIIIAVFERVQYDMLAMDSNPRSAPVGGLMRNYGEGFSGSGGGGGGKRPHKFRWPTEPEEPDEEDDELQVPDESNDLVVPGNEVPEPATMGLLAMGAGLALRYRRRAGK
jgi:hypothetical protein